MRAKFPWKLIFKANTELTPTDNSSRFFTQMIQGGRAEIPPGSVIYEVWATEGALPDEEPFKLGEIRSKSWFTQSLWSDERLFFAHASINNDIAALGGDKFIEENNLDENEPQFKFDK